MRTSFTPKARGLADLVNYAALVDEGICLLKDGGFLAGWTYTGPDLESASHEELAVLSSQVNSALVRLGNGWMLHVDAIRRPSVGHWGLTRAAKFDPRLSRIYVRHVRYQVYYPARPSTASPAAWVYPSVED